ncbi:hypothetical protein CaCOL14_012790 [Colletotrichum acutatum]
MVKPQFRQLDVESMGRLYEKMERKQKLAQLKRQRERGEQQQPQSLLPPTSPTTLEPDIRNLGVAQAQMISYTSGDFHNFPDFNPNFNQFKSLDTAEIAHTTQTSILPSEMDNITTASTGSFSPGNIQLHPKRWSPRTPLPDHPTKLASQREANSSLEDLSVASGLVRRTAGQLRPVSSLASDRNIVVADEEMSKSGEARQSCDADGLANDEISSSHDDTHSETCTTELVVLRPESTFQDSAEMPASQILSRSYPAMPDSMGSPSSATSSAPSLSIDASAVPLDRVEDPEAEVVALPTPPSDHASVSLQGGDAIISRGKRGRGAIEDDCESHGLRSSKRRRSRDAGSETASPAPQARTLRALPSRQRQRPPIMTETTSSLLGRRSFEKTGLKSSNRVPSPPVATSVGLYPVACHTCGFSAEPLLRMSDTVQALAGSMTDLSNSQKGLDILHLFVGFIRDHATKLSHNATSRSKSSSCGVRNHDHTVEAVIGPSNAETVKNDESSDNSDNDSEGASGSESESSSSDLSVSPDIPGKRAGMTKRLRWTHLDELRLRAWIQEEKEWSWIAGKLDRSEQAVLQHWKIMVKQEKRPGKRQMR